MCSIQAQGYWPELPDMWNPGLEEWAADSGPDFSLPRLESPPNFSVSPSGKKLQLKSLATALRVGARLQRGPLEKRAQPNTFAFSLSSAQTEPRLFPGCAEPCSCQSDDFNPVCDTSAHVEYITPCHAGCTGHVVQEALGKSQVRPASHTTSASRPLPLLVCTAYHSALCHCLVPCLAGAEHHSLSNCHCQPGPRGEPQLTPSCVSAQRNDPRGLQAAGGQTWSLLAHTRVKGSQPTWEGPREPQKKQNV